MAVIRVGRFLADRQWCEHALPALHAHRQGIESGAADLDGQEQDRTGIEESGRSRSPGKGGYSTLMVDFLAFSILGTINSSTPLVKVALASPSLTGAGNSSVRR